MSRARIKLIDKSLEDALGLPAWITAEDLPRFQRVWTLVRNEIQPSSIFDELAARDYAEKLFERLRLSKLQNDLIAGAVPLALRHLVDEAVADDLSQQAQVGRGLQKLRNRHGITDGVVEAHAFNLQRDGIEQLERMIAYRDQARARIEKEVRKRKSRARAGTGERANSNRVVDFPDAGRSRLRKE